MDLKRISGSTEGLSKEVSEEYIAKKAQSTAETTMSADSFEKVRQTLSACQNLSSHDVTEADLQTMSRAHEHIVMESSVFSGLAGNVSGKCHREGVGPEAGGTCTCRCNFGDSPRRMDEQTAINYRLYLDVCDQMTSELDVITLGIYVQCDEKLTERQLNQCRDLKVAAFNILRFVDKEYGPQEKWQKIIKAFEALGKNRAIAELGLRERLETEKEQTEVKQAVKVERVNENPSACLPQFYPQSPPTNPRLPEFCSESPQTSPCLPEYCPQSPLTLHLSRVCAVEGPFARNAH